MEVDKSLAEKVWSYLWKGQSLEEALKMATSREVFLENLKNVAPDIAERYETALTNCTRQFSKACYARRELGNAKEPDKRAYQNAEYSENSCLRKRNRADSGREYDQADVEYCQAKRKRQSLYEEYRQAARRYEEAEGNFDSDKRKAWNELLNLLEIYNEICALQQTRLEQAEKARAEKAENARWSQHMTIMYPNSMVFSPRQYIQESLNKTLEKAAVPGSEVVWESIKDFYMKKTA